MRGEGRLMAEICKVRAETAGTLCWGESL